MLRRIRWRIVWEQDRARNTLSRDIFWVQDEDKQDGDLSIQKVPTAKIVQLLERSPSLLLYYPALQKLQD